MITISIVLANIMQGVDNTILLISVVREMRATVFRTARSVAICEAKDFSCGLFDPEAQVVAQFATMRKDFEATEFNDGRRRSGHLPQTVD